MCHKMWIEYFDKVKYQMFPHNIRMDNSKEIIDTFENTKQGRYHLTSLMT